MLAIRHILAASLCALAMFAAAATLTASAAEPGTSVSVHPGDDFFTFANGEWLEATALPDGVGRFTARHEIEALTHRQLAKVFDDAAAAPAGTLGRKVADFRAAYANESAIEARGLASLKLRLERIERIRDKATLTELLGSRLRADVDPLNSGIYDSAHLLGLSVEEGNYGEKTCVAYLLQGGLGLPDQDDYLNAAADKQASRAKYVARIARVLSLAGFDGSAQKADAVMTLETAIAHTHATREASANDRNAGNLWTRADFAQRAPGMDWTAFFTAAGLAKRETFVVWQPTAITGAAALVDSQPIEVWKDYLRARALQSNADVLPRAFSDEDSTQPPRAQRALQATQQAMGEAIGRLYVEANFPPQFKTRVQSINANVVAAFRKRVEAVAWMSPASKKLALAKLSTLYVGLGYPERWRDFSAVVIDAKDALGNLERIADWNYHNALARLGQPVDTKQWLLTPQSVGAILVFQLNSYTFTAALLQPPKFDASASDAATYGAIGAVLGHDISHFIDNLGADYDTDFAARRWWTAEDLARFENAAEPLAKQFESYRAFPDLAVNGRSTLSENVADLAGVSAAFDAYRASLGPKASDAGFVRQQDRTFFIAFARAWRAKSTDDALRKQIATDHHAPDAFRIATVRNLDAWYEAFDVKPGHRLYLDPKSRVRVW